GGQGSAARSTRPRATPIVTPAAPRGLVLSETLILRQAQAERESKGRRQQEKFDHVDKQDVHRARLSASPDSGPEGAPYHAILIALLTGVAGLAGVRSVRLQADLARA